MQQQRMVVSTRSEEGMRFKMFFMVLRSWFGMKVVPKRYISMDVGKEKETMMRYLIPIPFLTHAEFQKLLEDSVAEFGHSYTGALRLACEEQELQTVLHHIGLTLWATKLITGHQLQPSTWYCVGH